MSAITAGRKNRTIVVSALRAELEALRVVGEESVRNGTSKLFSRQIDKIIKAPRSEKSKR